VDGAGRLTLLPVAELTQLERDRHSVSLVVAGGDQAAAANVSALSRLHLVARAIGQLPGAEGGGTEAGKAWGATREGGEGDKTSWLSDATGTVSFGIALNGIAVQANIALGARGVVSASLQVGRTCCAPLSVSTLPVPPDRENLLTTWAYDLRADVWLDRFILEAYADGGSAVVSATLFDGRANVTEDPFAAVAWASPGCLNVSFELDWVELAVPNHGSIATR